MGTLGVAICMGVYYWIARLRFGYTISSALLQPATIGVFVGLITGNGTEIDGEPNCMWEDVLTREQFATVLYRFAKIIGKA